MLITCPGVGTHGIAAHEHDETDFYISKGKRDRICKPCRRTVQRKYEARYEQRVREGKARHARSRRFGQYGITEAEFDAMVATQCGMCFTCERPLPLQIDHCHATGRVRGLLCGDCNKALGLLRDEIPTLERMVRYLAQTA